MIQRINQVEQRDASGSGHPWQATQPGAPGKTGSPKAAQLTGSRGTMALPEYAVLGSHKDNQILLETIKSQKHLQEFASFHRFGFTKQFSAHHSTKYQESHYAQPSLQHTNNVLVKDDNLPRPDQVSASASDQHGKETQGLQALSLGPGSSAQGLRESHRSRLEKQIRDQKVNDQIEVLESQLEQIHFSNSKLQKLVKDPATNSSAVLSHGEAHQPGGATSGEQVPAGAAAIGGEPPEGGPGSASRAAEGKWGDAPHFFSMTTPHMQHDARVPLSQHSVSRHQESKGDLTGAQAKNPAEAASRTGEGDVRVKPGEIKGVTIEYKSKPQEVGPGLEFAPVVPSALAQRKVSAQPSLLPPVQVFVAPELEQSGSKASLIGANIRSPSRQLYGTRGSSTAEQRQARSQKRRSMVPEQLRLPPLGRSLTNRKKTVADLVSTQEMAELERQFLKMISKRRP